VPGEAVPGEAVPGEAVPGEAGSRETVPGVAVGHWSDPEALTGCTVVLLPEGTVASGEVRGGAPGTREWELLAPERMVAHLDAVVLTGGSAFGLAACDGVVRWCEERGRGLPTVGGRVPIVVGAVLYDLASGDRRSRPGAEEGYLACEEALPGPVQQGRVGAGTGATVAKCRGRASARPGGLGSASESEGDLVVWSLMAVNAYGDLLAEGKPPPAGELLVGGSPILTEASGGAAIESTTIGVLVTNARLDKPGCFLLAQSGQDGLARALEPVHTRFDGDAVVAAATGRTEAPLELVRVLGARAVAGAVRRALA
jgi:L-aminopeptidase/D-esterase-like protein